ncbi:MAG: hypothetical protein KIT22_00500 [Verrucomicrobiae bacterium]|nr:hypothetical protein [Verrucomicrobiae bacterium]
MVANDPLVMQLKARIADADSKLAGLRARYTDKHPSVEPLLRGLERDRQTLTNEAERAFRAIFSTSFRSRKQNLAESRKRRGGGGKACHGRERRPSGI